MPEEVIRLATPAMGTRFELVLVGEHAPRLRAVGEEALGEIRHWHDRLNWLGAGSFVSHLNARAAHGPVCCDAEFYALLVLCREVWRASDGAFDPTIAALMRASGFRGVQRDAAAIERARAVTGFDQVEMCDAARTVRFVRPGVGIDLGAVGKGWAVDAAARILREGGVRAALIHGGTSSVMGIGAPGGEEGWAVKLGPGPGDPVARLRHLSLGVSAPSGRVVKDGPGEHGHVLDPRTGVSARGRAAAVIAESCALADAWSTVVLIEGQRPPGMPAGLTAIVGPEEGTGGGWRIDGPHAAILFGS